MKVTQESLPASQVGLDIEITPEMSKQAYEKTLQDFVRSANIPGFRKGKVPRQILIQRYGSSRIKAAVLEELIEKSLREAIEQEKIEAIGNFELRSSFEELVNQFEPGASLTISAKVDVPPKATLSQYKGLTIQAEEIKYDPTRVDETLENYRRRTATLVPAEDRPAQEGDIAVVDFSGRLAEIPEGETEPKEIPGGSATDFEIELAEGRFIPGFVDGMIGMAPGETKEVSVTFPADYSQTDLAGQPAVFTITLKELKVRELPDLDDEFAQEISDFKTLEELKASLESRYQKEAEDKTRNNKQQAILNELVQHLEVDIPETIIRQELDYMLTQTMMQFGNQGYDIRQTFTREIVAQLRERSRPEAIERIRRSLALGEVAKQESITIDEAAVSAKVNETLEDYREQDIDLDRLREVVQEDLLKDQVFVWLEEHSTIELVPEGTLKPAEEQPELLESVEDESATAAPPVTDAPANEPTAESFTPSMAEAETAEAETAEAEVEQPDELATDTPIPETPEEVEQTVEVSAETVQDEDDTTTETAQKSGKKKSKKGDATE